MEKTCNICGQLKDVSKFAKHETGKLGVRTYCKECRYLSYSENKDRRGIPRKRRSTPQQSKGTPFNIKRYYKIEPIAEYCLKLKHQKCQICGREDRLCIDHCHSTGVIRGILCRNCNAGIGLLKDSPEILRAAADYLSIIRQQPVTL